MSLCLQDFDLCLSCYDTTKHEHPMEKAGVLGMIDPEDQETTVEQDPQVWSMSRALPLQAVLSRSVLV